MATAATITEGQYRSRPAGADLSALQYHFVKLNASKEVVACDDITDKAYGVLQNAPISGEPARVKVIGETKVAAAAAIALEAFVGPAANSKCQTAVSTQFVRGKCVDPVSNANDLAIIELFDTAVALA